MPGTKQDRNKALQNGNFCGRFTQDFICKILTVLLCEVPLPPIMGLPGKFIWDQYNMSDNTTTFYRAADESYSMCLPVIAVEVEGEPAPWLELKEVTRYRGPRLNEACFKLVNHNAGPGARFENVVNVVLPGQRIQADIIGTNNPATGCQIRWPLFSGVVKKGTALIAGNGEEAEILAVDRLTYHNGVIVDGYRCLGGNNNEGVFVNSREVVFNPDGRGNCSATAAIDVFRETTEGT